MAKVASLATVPKFPCKHKLQLVASGFYARALSKTSFVQDYCFCTYSALKAAFQQKLSFTSSVSDPTFPSIASLSPLNSTTPGIFHRLLGVSRQISNNKMVQAPSDTRKKGRKFDYYGVKAGHKTGVFSDWQQCLAQVTGFSGAQCKFPFLSLPLSLPP